jgi:hypothetical protein
MYISNSFGGYLDRQIFGSKIFAEGGDGVIGRWCWLPIDPEGVWGYLTSLFNTFMGMCFTLILRKF